MITYRYCKYGGEKNISTEIGSNRALSIGSTSNQPRYIVLSDGMFRVSFDIKHWISIYLEMATVGAVSFPCQIT